MKKYLVAIASVLPLLANGGPLPTAFDVQAPIMPKDVKECAQYKLQLDAQENIVEAAHQTCLDKWKRSEKPEFAGGAENCTVMQCQAEHIALHRFEANSKMNMENCYQEVKLYTGQRAENLAVGPVDAPATIQRRIPNSPVKKDDSFDDLLAMSEELDQQDKNDFGDAINAANSCTQQRDFNCAESQLARAGKTAVDSKDKRTLADARQRLANERAEVVTEERRAEEARQYALQQQRAREQAARENDAHTANMIASGVMGLMGAATGDRAMMTGAAVGLATGDAALGAATAQGAAMLDAARNGGTPAYNGSIPSAGGGSGGNCAALQQQASSYAGDLSNVCTQQGKNAVSWFSSNASALRSCGIDMSGTVSSAKQQQSQLCN